MNENLSFRVAGFWTRLLAYSIDLICIGVFGHLVISGLGIFGNESLQRLELFSGNFAILGIVGFTYFSVMTKVWSQTLGKMIVGIRVIRIDGQPLDWKTIFTREVAGRTIAQLFGSHFGYLWVAFGQDKKGWHDWFADTYVVYVEEFERKRWVNITNNG